MARWIRNLGTQAVSDSWGTHMTAMVIYNIFKMLGWTVADNGDTAWANTLLINDAGGGGIGTGFEVDATDPRVIYDTQGRFTQAMADNENTICLFGGVGDYEQNHSMWRIVEYIDANHVKVDPLSWNPFGWATDTQLGGRVINFGAQILAASAWATFDAPSSIGRQRVRIDYISTSVLNVSVAPMYSPLTGNGNGTTDSIGGTAPTMTVTIAALIGKLNKQMIGTNVAIAGATNALDNGTFPITAVDTTTGTITYTNASGVGESGFSGTATVDGITTFTATIDMGNYYCRRMRLSMYADADVIHIYYTNRQGNNSGIYPWNFLSTGRLLGAATGDSDPVFLFGDAVLTSTRWPWNTEIFMLDGGAGPASIQCWMGYWKAHMGIADDDNNFNRFGRRLINGSPGKVLLLEPWVVLANTAVVGGAVRGRFPKLRLGYTGMDKLRPVDSAGAWVHFVWGHFYPMNGPGDPLPMLTEW